MNLILEGNDERRHILFRPTFMHGLKTKKHRLIEFLNSQMNSNYKKPVCWQCHEFFIVFLWVRIIVSIRKKFPADKVIKKCTKYFINLHIWRNLHRDSFGYYILIFRNILRSPMNFHTL